MKNSQPSFMSVCAPSPEKIPCQKKKKYCTLTQREKKKAKANRSPTKRKLVVARVDIQEKRTGFF